MRTHRTDGLPIPTLTPKPRLRFIVGLVVAVALAALVTSPVGAQLVSSSGFVLVRFWDGTNVINAGDNTNNAIRVNVVAGSSGNAAAAATGAAVPASASYTGVNVAGTHRGLTGVNPSGSIFAAQIDEASVAGTTTDVNTGNATAGTQRVVLASNQPAIPASQSGAWTVQPGNTANTTPWLVSSFPKTACGTTVFNQAFAAVPTTATAVATSTTCVLTLTITNTNASTDQTVTITDNAGSPVTVINALLIPAKGTVTWPLGGAQFASGIKWSAGGTGMVGAIVGLQ